MCLIVIVLCLALCLELIKSENKTIKSMHKVNVFSIEDFSIYAN